MTWLHITHSPGLSTTITTSICLRRHNRSRHTFCSNNLLLPPMLPIRFSRPGSHLIRPEDIKTREIYHFFREFLGYESSHLRTPTKTSQPFAFAVFYNQQSAIAAMHALNLIELGLTICW